MSEAELLKGGTRCNLDLRSDNIDASDLLSDGVLDLDTGVDLDEVVPVLLIDKELSGTSVAVVDRLGQLDRIVEDGIPSLGGEILGGGNLNDLLVAALNGAVTLVQMDNVAVVVTEQLDLDVLRAVEETLNEDSTVAESRLGLGCSSLEGLLEALGFADDSHTTATTSVGSLDNDGETILVGKGLDLLVRGDSVLCARNDGDIGGNGKLSSGNLVTKRVDDFVRGANELQAVSFVVANARAPQRRAVRLTIRPAFSTLRANWAFSDKKP